MFSLQLKAISRSSGRSAAGTVAYVSSSIGEDPYTGKRFDYSRKGGTLSVDVVGFEGTARDLAEKLDRDERRVNSTVCREAIVALPHQLSDEERKGIAVGLAESMNDRWGVSCVVALHAPPRSGDSRNHHAHIVFSTRNGEGKKTRVLDERRTGKGEVEWLRSEASKRIQQLIRRKWLPSGIWDHRSYERRDLKLVPTRHEGPLATSLRRQGQTIRSLGRALENDLVRASRAEARELAERVEETRREEADRLERERQQAVSEEKRKRKKESAARLQAAREELEKARGTQENVRKPKPEADRDQRLEIRRYDRDQGKNRDGPSMGM